MSKLKTLGWDEMTELLSAGQMRAIEAAAIESGAVTGLELMERAGRGVVEAVFAEWPELQRAPHRAVVLCGPGNNGGDGFVIARLLKDWGWEVEVFLYGDPAKLPPDARTSYHRWAETGGVAAVPEQGLPVAPGTALMVDALFGTGLARGVTGKPLGRALRDMADCSAQGAGLDLDARAAAGAPVVVAVDIPSGLCADSGRVLGKVDSEQGSRAACGGADLTVSFHRRKLGHVLGDGPACCGHLRVADIGLGAGRPVGSTRCIDGPGRLGRAGRPGAHKYDHGHVLVLSGGMGRSGAARLAARAALRVGAGLVTVAAPGGAMMECAAQLTAVMLRRCDDAGQLLNLLEDARLTALCLGPGLGVGAPTRARVAAALAARRRTVLDADALTSFAGAPNALFELTRGAQAVLTPHSGEFARLFPDLAARLEAAPETGPAYSKVDAAREAAARAGCTVLIKGADTVIADAEGHCRVHAAVYDRAAPWLATAGAGDVLAGLIAGLLARGLSPLDAASSAAWLHVEAARAFGPGLIAEDLPEMLPQVLGALAAPGA